MFIPKIRKVKVINLIVGLCFLTTVCIVVYKRYSTGKNLKEKWSQTMAESRYFFEQGTYEKSKITCKSAVDIAATMEKEDTCFSRSQILLGEIFLAEVKLDSAEAAFKKAVDFSPGISDHRDNPDLVKPLESLANFYYFVDHNSQKAIPIYERILKIIESSNTFPASEVAAKNYSLARVYQKEKQFERAELLYFRTLDLSKSKGGNVSEVLLNMATFYQEWSKCEKAVEYADQSIVVLKKSTNLHEESTLLYAQFCYYAAEVYLKCEKTAQSENLFKESLSVIEKASNTQTSDLIWPLAGLAKTLQRQGKIEDAKLLYERALFIAEKNFDPNSRETTEVLNLYTSFLNSVQQEQVANVLVKDHEWKKLMYNATQALKTTNVNEALNIAKEAFKIASEFGKDDIRISRSQALLGEVYRSTGNLDQSERSFNDAVTTSERKSGSSHPDIIEFLESQANFYLYTKVNKNKVAGLYSRILEIEMNRDESNSIEIARRARNLGDIYDSQGKKNDAEKLYKLALAEAEKTNIQHKDVIVQYQEVLANFYLGRSEYFLAESYALKALDLRRNNISNTLDDQLGIAVSLDLLGKIYFSCNKLKNAEDVFKESLAIIEKISGDKDLELVPRLVNLGKVYHKTGRYDSAQELFTRSITITKNSLDADPPEMADILTDYALLLKDMKKPDEAKIQLAKAESIRKNSMSTGKFE